jgi:DNA-binding NarL/FixJ family response regulator
MGAAGADWVGSTWPARLHNRVALAQAALAQSVEHLTRNEVVRSSILRGGSLKGPYLLEQMVSPFFSGHGPKFHQQRKTLTKDLMTEGFTQADIARELGVSRQAVQKMLSP